MQPRPGQEGGQAAQHGDTIPRQRAKGRALRKGCVKKGEKRGRRAVLGRGSNTAACPPVVEKERGERCVYSKTGGGGERRMTTALCQKTTGLFYAADSSSSACSFL